MVVAQHSAKALAPFDWNAGITHYPRLNQQQITQPLMVTFTMIVRQILTNRMSDT
jgi:hypothetical protein